MVYLILSDGFPYPTYTGYRVVRRRIVYMEFVQTESFESFQAIVSSMPRDKIIFRGVKDSEKHLLITSIGRAYIITKKSGFPSYERSLIKRFQERAIPYLIYVPATDLEWLALAQHHGLPTRLLD